MAILNQREHSLTIRAGERAIVLVSDSAGTIDYCDRYTGGWGFRADSGEGVPVARRIVASVNKEEVEQVRLELTLRRTSTETVLREAFSVADRSGVITALNVDRRVAYRAPETGTIEVFATREADLKLAVSRLVRELGRAELQRTGWRLMHASCIVGPGGQAMAALGDKGAGKTTTALTMSVVRGWPLVANDRLFVRRGVSGLEGRAWPSAVAIGLGLASSLSILDTVRERLAGGDAPHDTQDPRVTEAVLAGETTTVRGNSGRELKLQLYPHQLHEWFGIELADRAEQIACIARPHVSPTTINVALQATQAVVSEADFFDGLDDLYPDFLRIRGSAKPILPENVAALTSDLPGVQINMGHDAQENADLIEQWLQRDHV